MLQRICCQAMRCVTRPCSASKRLVPQSFITSLRQYSLYEPPYLDIKPEIPFYGTLNISLRGYDFAVLESFTRYVHMTADALGLDTEAFPVPARTSKVQLLKSMSAQVEKEYNMELYERVVQVDDLKSTVAPIFFETIQLNTPAGVQVSIKPPTEEDTEFRYVPDLTLLELKSQFSELEKAKEERKKK